MYNTPKTKEEILKTIAELAKNNMTALLVENEDEARKKVLEMIPKEASVMTMTSVTLEKIGIPKEINESGLFNSVRTQLKTITDEDQRRQIANAPQYTVGSVHAVTEDGSVMIASNTGSQLPAYAYSAKHVIWVVGTQKIVKNLDEGFKRIYEYVLPLESERATKAYGSNGSFVSKLLIVNKEVTPGRITIIFVPESIGF
jgi:L-lactate utilization protein LutC